jgi:hypothetical protein
VKHHEGLDVERPRDDAAERVLMKQRHHDRGHEGEGRGPQVERWKPTIGDVAGEAGFGRLRVGSGLKGVLKRTAS